MRRPRWFRTEYLIILLAVIVRFIPGPRTIDDAYITFRYSQNLLNGFGLVYNPGEPVLGTTTPLYAILLSISAFFAGGSQAPYPWIALAINAIADGITCWLLLRLAKQWGYPKAGYLTGLLWALSPMSVTFAIGGMETSLNILLLMGSLYMYSTRRPAISALLAAFSLLARPDSLIAILPLLLARLISSFRAGFPRIQWKEILGFSVPLAFWSLIAYRFYGSPIPQSVTAKSLAYNLPTDAALIRLLQHFATPFQGNLIFGRYYIALGLLLFPALCVLGWRQVLRKDASVWPLAIYPLTYFITFSLANPLIFRWYLVPPLPLYFLGISIGLEGMTRQFGKRWLLSVSSGVLLLLTLNAWSIKLDHGPARPAPEMAYIKLELLYTQAIESFDPPVDQKALIASGDIGVVGYLSQSAILDLVGLISPQTTEYFPLPEDSYVINYAIPSRLILDLEPDYVIMLEVYGRRTLLRSAEFEQLYALKDEFPTDIYGSEAMLIFEHR